MTLGLLAAPGPFWGPLGAPPWAHFPLWTRKNRGIGHGRLQIARFGREKCCINAAKPLNFIIFSLQNATVRHFLAFWVSKSLKSRFKLQLAFGTASGSDLGPQNGSKMAPKSTPRGSQDAPGARLPLEAVF